MRCRRRRRSVDDSFKPREYIAYRTLLELECRMNWEEWVEERGARLYTHFDSVVQRARTEPTIYTFRMDWLIGVFVCVHCAIYICICNIFPFWSVLLLLLLVLPLLHFTSKKWKKTQIQLHYIITRTHQLNNEHETTRRKKCMCAEEEAEKTNRKNRNELCVSSVYDSGFCLFLGPYTHTHTHQRMKKYTCSVQWLFIVTIIFFLLSFAVCTIAP